MNGSAWLLSTAVLQVFFSENFRSTCADIVVLQPVTKNGIAIELFEIFKMLVLLFILYSVCFTAFVVDRKSIRVSLNHQKVICSSIIWNVMVDCYAITRRTLTLWSKLQGYHTSSSAMVCWLATTTVTTQTLLLLLLLTYWNWQQAVAFRISYSAMVCQL